MGVMLAIPLANGLQCSYFVLMTERKEQLGNVAFGGNWSEEILIVDELRQMLGVLESAAACCAETDVEDDNLGDALQYVQRHIEKGAMLAAAFTSALRIENQNSRRAEAQRVAGMIRLWAGL